MAEAIISIKNSQVTPDQQPIFFSIFDQKAISVHESLVSIIIPTFNRAHLIGETLDSVLAQTYQNWECIVVDDGSRDNTDVLMKEYMKKDLRVRYFQRPKEHLAGGCGARNYGLKRAEGDYIVFFDSDDLMTINHLQEKIHVLESSNFDYAIAKTKFFDSLDPWIEVMYKGIKENLSAENFILQKISWLTPDICVRAILAKSISFNEVIHSGQEYNYFSKLVLISVNACFIEKYLTLRRTHEGSIRTGLESRAKKMISAYISCWLTYLDIRYIAVEQIKKGLLLRCVDMIYKNRKINFPYQKNLINAVFKEYGTWEGINFTLMLFFNKYFNNN